eukprot:1852170-Amphidinium_carterae.1
MGTSSSIHQHNQAHAMPLLRGGREKIEWLTLGMLAGKGTASTIGPARAQFVSSMSGVWEDYRHVEGWPECKLIAPSNGFLVSSRTHTHTHSETSNC